MEGSLLELKAGVWLCFVSRIENRKGSSNTSFSMIVRHGRFRLFNWMND
ncbi:MAG TPA: hypothetical protein VL053_16160 [Arachidicoccus sp.]|nr:hypothetical protein [Arachidicoccus sp.]